MKNAFDGFISNWSWLRKKFLSLRIPEMQREKIKKTDKKRIEYPKTVGQL